jgi:two-component system chemotaxis sensor kinase CheA
LKGFDPQLLAIFEAEGREHIQRLRDLLSPEAAPATLEEGLRRAHTLKGAARAVSIESIERVSHRLETLFARVREGAVPFDDRALGAARLGIDFIEDALASVLAGGGDPDAAPALETMENALGRQPHKPAAARETGPRHPGEAADLSSRKLVRVNAGSVDELVRSSTQLLAASGGQLQAARGIDELARGIAAFEQEWARVRRGLSAAPRRQTAPDPQFSERLDLISGRIESLARRARELNRTQQRASWELHQLSERLYSEACAVRMTPAGMIFDPFHKMMRDLARAEGKEVEFAAEGLDVEADRLVLQALKDPVMHLLRNAVAHGIETPAQRTAAGKPRAGSVKLRLEARGDQLRVSVDDDGRGIDFARVAQVAAGRGLIDPAAAEGQPARALARLLFEPGFSTSAGVTSLAGRGMGLSVVREQLTLLQGEVTFPEKEGPGTSVLLSAPLSISTHHVVLVSCGEQVYAIPARAVERLCRVQPGEIEMIESNEAIRIGGRPVLLASLAELLEVPVPAPQAVDGRQPAVFVAVLNSAGELAGIIVDRFVDERRAVVKDLGLPPAHAGISSGGVPLDNGGVAVVLSPAGLFDRFRRNGKSPGLKAAAEAPAKKSKILVVDDSITTRSLEKSILEAHGYAVRVAVDGVDAMAQIRAERPDLVITDMMMPRMDGFELLERIKKDRNLAAIPVIVVTSLEREEDRERGLTLGADAYVVKRKFDQRELLRVVRQIL